MGATHLTAGWFAEQRDPDVAEQDELAARASEGASRVEPRHRGELALDPIRTCVEVDRVPLGMAGNVVELVGHEDEQIVDG